ncbi:DNA internalization-related competence protein ComEC/Rec2 [Halobacillus sp. ACCC02827]|uniref:DNA internalization-related competence protein ComEC/Rec2 n=1 Tax=Halobacillus sp. ACCC02827 TaxID=3052090 RepID=UPI003364EC46
MMWKGIWHVPVLAFVLGGVTAIQSIAIQLVMGFLVVVWLFIHRKQTYWCFILASFFILGWSYLPLPESPPFEAEKARSFQGTLSSNRTETSHTYQTIIETSDGTGFILRLFKEEEGPVPDWPHGASCVGVGDVEQIEGARNPGNFDYKNYMASKGIYQQITLASLSDLECEGRSFLSYLFEFRKNMMDALEEQVEPSLYPWMRALLFGDSGELPEDTLFWFRKFNLAHVLAISGLHVGLTVGGMYLVLFRSGVATRRQASLFLMFFLPFYIVFAGSAPSVIRAGLMALVLLLFSFLKIRIPLSDLLSVTAFVLLLLNPSYFHHIGFQFSFLVTFSLILSLPILKQYSNAVLQSAVISLISQLSILSLQVHYFYEFQPLSLFVNTVLVPYFSFVFIPLLFLVFACSFLLPQTAGPFSSFVFQLHEYVMDVSKGVTSYMDIPWVIGAVPSSVILLYSTCFILMVICWSKKKRITAFLAACGAVGVLMIYSAIPYFSDKGAVTMLDVGQGDSFIIELPYRSGVLMIDAAGPPTFQKAGDETAKQIILPFLKSRGIHQLDALIVTHEDQDHSGSVFPLFREMQVGQLVVSPFYEGETIADKTEVIEAGDVLEIGSYRFEVLHPNEDQNDANHNSLVLASELGGKRWLFTGDVPLEVEEEILSGHPDIHTDVLKVGHHGSRTSTSESFLEQLSVEYAWISVGRNNRYGHPHEEVTQRLEERGTVIFRTDLHGAVSYIFSGQSGTFRTYLPYNASRE